MAADFIKKLVLLNLGATEDEWADAVAIDEEAVALDAYSKTGGVALQSFFSDETPSGSAVFFYFETHADKGKPAERKLRCHSYTIPQSGLMDAMQFGTLTDSLLSNMGTLLRELYVPQGGGAEQAGDAGGSPVRAAALEAEDLEAGAAKHEFQRNVVWFESVLSHAMKQVKGDVLLSVPNIDIEDAKAASEDYDVVNQLEVAMESWSKLVATVVEAENSKRPKTKGAPRGDRDILKVLKMADAQMVATFNYNFGELQKLYVEAKDNVKFLTTLERHFKNITHGSFTTILDTLPSMMNAIRMVWIISRHYNTDLRPPRRMVPLMERIAYKIAEKVETEVNIKTILRRSPEQAKKRIEESGTHIRWEFDRKRLFELTKYMAHVCGHLFEVATVLDQFHKFLGPELKAVTGESDGIDQVMERVERLVEPLESVPFNIFDRRYKESWSKVMDNFHDHVEQIEDMTRSFIEQSFQKLRSAEGAARSSSSRTSGNIQSRESINQQINDRYKDILQQYTKELEAIHGIFDTHRENPPIYKNFPPVAGAAHEGLLSTEYGEQVKQRYLTFARAVDAYITSLYREWEAHVQQVATEKLKQPILAAAGKEAKGDAGEGDGEAPAPDAVKGASGRNKSAAKFKMPPPPYRVNFVAELSLIIRESKYLDRMGFAIPDAALNVTLQEDKYHSYRQNLQLKLRKYDALLASLSPRGRIPFFIEACDKALNEFAGVVSQIQKSSTMIDEIVAAIEGTVLAQAIDLRSDGRTGAPVLTDVTEFYEAMETKRVARLQNLVQKYRSIESLLKKVEEVVATSNNGNSPLLAGYYKLWEKRIFNAITMMITKSLAAFQEMLRHEDCTPFILVKCTLNGKDLVVTPPPSDLNKYFTKAVKNIVESAKVFVRWKRGGTCLECEPQVVHEDEEPFVFSFFQDVSSNQHIVALQRSLTANIQNLTMSSGKISNYLESWTIYDRNEQAVAQDARSSIEFIHIDASAVAEGIASQALQWRDQYGDILRVASKKAMDVLTEKIEAYEKDMAIEPEDLEALKFVLNTITTITDESMDMELKYFDVMERYRTLQRYDVAVAEEESSVAAGLAARWHALYCTAKTKDLRLAKVKEEFREVTTQQAADVTLEDGVALLVDYKRTLAKCHAKKSELVNAENLFDLEITPYPVLATMSEELRRLSLIYKLYEARARAPRPSTARAAEPLARPRDFMEFRTTMSESLWGELDINALKGGVETAEKQMRKLPGDLKENSKFKAVETVIANFKESLPVIVNLKNEAMKDRHWNKLTEVTGVPIDNVKSITLAKIFAMELQNFGGGHRRDRPRGHQRAEDRERDPRDRVDVGVDESRRARLLQGRHAARGFILGGAEEIKLNLEDNMLNLQTMSGSRFVGAFAQKVRSWEKTLNLVNETLDVWFNVQRQWMYLESIFVGSEDIRMQLPEEAKKFDAINKACKGIVTSTNQQPNVIKACTSNNCFDVLTNLGERLDKCQKSLTDYLDTKRNAFSRFYFISDDELLSVLGSSDPTSIQVHMLKLFDNVKELIFARNAKSVTGMVASEKESFNLDPPSPIDGPVEVWMTKVEESMKESLHGITKAGVYNYAQMDRGDWILDANTLGMVTLAGSQIWWTWEVEDAFRLVGTGDKYALKNLEQKLTGQLNDLVAMVRTSLNKINRKKVNTLLIIDVHSRDIVDSFIRESILHAKEFAWESQLRFYWDRDIDDCVIKQCTGFFRYGCEYMGLNGRLVITPLTDRCYMTITQALTFKLGGSPAGPAGTGKTETVKDLAKSPRCPASSAQLRSIQNALIYDKPSCDIGMGEIFVKRVAGFATCGFFITMNPGYAGRTELPDNLKALFRPVTMIVPDLQMICEIMLFSEGFEGAKVLARKMTVLYKLSKEQLSKQYHYDFGLRSLKSVLVMAGGLKREYSDLPEDLVLMRVLRDSNMPKYVFEDVPLFKGLITDLFPGLDAPRVGYEDLKVEVALELEKGGYKCSDEAVHKEQIDKVIQMYETMIVRHTTMIVGPTGGGKTLVLDTLKSARLAAENVLVRYWVINPKAQPLHELYGIMDPVTRDWTDGVLSRLFRELNEPLPKGKENEMRWIIYDGDVDAVWVENMNSVMDDNRLLTLPNGERIRLQPHCAMICETFDLQYASPATISRCGMVWVDPKNLGYRPFYERWVRKRCGNGRDIAPDKEEEAGHLEALFDQYVTKCIDYVQFGLVDGELGAKLRSVIPITSIDMIKQLATALDAFLGPLYEHMPPETLPERDDIENVYAFCVNWSIGAALLGSSMELFNAFVKKIATCGLPDGLIADNVFDPESKRHLLQEMAPRKPILFVGASGTAKTTIINDYLGSLDDETNIEANVDKRTGNFYGPPVGKKLTIFIDDMNMPKVDTYGTQQPITLLLTLISRGFIYDRERRTSRRRF
ncbi:dynein light chain binding protein [Aureococcus anophagefferens]|nr:dynein light chain binding protein [Aureococcus anophagefferens]